MIVFILLSILLHLISILAIVVLYKRRSLERVNVPTLKEDVTTLQESMEDFVNEVEKENEHLYQDLVEHIKKRENKWQQEIDHLQQRLTLIEHKHNSVREEKNEEDANLEIEKNQQDIKPVEVKQEELNPEELQQEKLDEDVSSIDRRRVIEMYAQGFSVDQIAQILHMGKGEVQLLTTLHQKSHQIH